jgi:hypothetical protein
MAENLHHHVVNEAQSMSAPSPVGDIAATSLLASAVGQPPATLPIESRQVDDETGECLPPPREYAKSPLDKALLQADASGGSDTDSGRKESAGHARSNSVKKPTSFKAVSVTKSFLAKVVTGAQVARPGEKGLHIIPTTHLADRVTAALPPALALRLLRRLPNPAWSRNQHSVDWDRDRVRPEMAARPLVPMPAKSGTRIDVRPVWLC